MPSNTIKKTKKETRMVSIVIPTRNSSLFLENTLKSIKAQTYKNIETIVVDGNSKDKTVEISKKYKTILYNFVPKVSPGTFDAPYKRNYGAKKSKGTYIYYVDADMELTPDLIAEAVKVCDKGYDGVILPEDSFGIGVWAQAKNLERRCYWEDDSVEAPRFFKKSVWVACGGLDESLGGGGDDWDLYQKVLEKGYKVGRTRAMVMHNEGNLTLKKLALKHYMYGKDVRKYVSKRPKMGIKSYFPIRPAFIRNWRMFVSRPRDTFYFIIMKTVESFAGLAGVTYSFIYG